MFFFVGPCLRRHLQRQRRRQCLQRLMSFPRQSRCPQRPRYVTFQPPTSVHVLTRCSMPLASHPNNDRLSPHRCAQILLSSRRAQPAAHLCSRAGLPQALQAKVQLRWQGTIVVSHLRWRPEHLHLLRVPVLPPPRVSVAMKGLFYIQNIRCCHGVQKAEPSVWVKHSDFSGFKDTRSCYLFKRRCSL